MKRHLILAATALSLLTGTAHAAPTCHQKVTLSSTEHFSDTVKISSKVSKMVRQQALDLISSPAADYEANANAFVAAVAVATATVLKTTVSDEIKDLARQSSAYIVKSYGTLDKSYGKDPITLDGTKNSLISTTTSTIITAFFACK